MQASITFLGTGGARSAVHQVLATGGIVFKLGSHQIHLDPGPGALSKAKQYGVDIEHNSIILLSSLHVNHCNDVNALIEAMTDSGAKKRGIVVSGGNAGEYVSSRHREMISENVSLEPGKSLDIDGIIFHAIQTKNTIPTSAFKISAKDVIIGYTSDTELTHELEKGLENSDVLIINTIQPFGKKAPHALSSEDAVKLIEKVKPRLAIITHFGISMLRANPLYEAREISTRTGIQVIAATDGLKVDPTAYSAKAGQRMLSGY